MEILFKNKKLENTFNKGAELVKKYGQEMAKKIQLRMAVLRAAKSLENVPHNKPCRRHELSGKKSGMFAIDLKHPYRLVFEPVHDPLPVNKSGGIDLSQVRIIKILSVEDYH